MRTVREATFDALRRLGMTTVFANPGSTEIPLLVGLPDDLDFVLALHEGCVVGLATGYALAREQPALVLLHTTAGLGNAVGALATARVNRAPLVVLVGQQDRRHLALEPFLAGQLSGLAGSYPVWVDQPVRAADVPGAVVRARHEAVTGRGPALVVICMDDWPAPFAEEVAIGPYQLSRPVAVADSDLAELVALLAKSRSPAMVVGARADGAAGWAATQALAEALRCPVWQEPFGARAGFPQDHPQFAGHLPATRSGQRATLGGHDVVLVVGAPVFRQYGYESGRLVADGTRVAVVTDDPAEAHRSPADLAVLADPAVVCRRLAELVPPRTGPLPPPMVRRVPAAPAPGEPLRAGHVLAALAERLPPEAVLFEEAPSSKPQLHEIIVARSPMGFVSPAMGGLGFALPAAAGLRMGLPQRPVVAVVGDGSALYGIQALWSAARYGCGVLYVVMANGRYAVMDGLAEAHGGGKPPWPGFEEVSLSGLARSLGCPALRIETYPQLIEALDDVLPGLAGRAEPLLLDVAVLPEPANAPDQAVAQAPTTRRAAPTTPRRRPRSSRPGGR